MTVATNGFDKDATGGGFGESDGAIDWSEGNIMDLSISSASGNVFDSTSESVTGSATAQSLSDDINRQSEALRTHDDFVKNESLAVRCSKIFVVMAIMAATVACSLVVSHLVRASEIQDFETEVCCTVKSLYLCFVSYHCLSHSQDMNSTFLLTPCRNLVLEV